MTPSGRSSSWLILDAGDDARRWQQLLQALPFLPEPDRQRIREALATRAGAGTLSDDGRADLWETLREFIARHRSRSGRQAALPAGELDALQDVERGARARMIRSSGTGGCSRGSSRIWVTAGGSAIPHTTPPCGSSAPRRSLKSRIADLTPCGNSRRTLLTRGSSAPAWPRRRATSTAPRLVAMIPAARADEGLTEGWLARRFQQDGWSWLDGLLAEELTPEQAAVALLASRDYPKAWQVAETRGAPVAEAFWRYFSISGLGHGFSHATEAAGRLAQAGRVAAALKLAVIYIDDLGGQSADFLIGLLGQFASTYRSDPEIPLVTEYDFRSVFEYLNQHADPERSAEVGQLEWVFLAVLGFEPPIGQLYETLAADPDFFVKVMEVAWRASDAESDEDDEQDDGTVPEDEPLTDEQVQQAENGFMLLTSFDRLPGTGPDGRVDLEALRRWVTRALDLAAASGRRKVAEALIGQILASAPADGDGTWPCRPVRDLLEELQSERVERNLAVRLYNRRGVTVRDPEDGGKQERLLVEQYRAQATAFSNSWPQTAAVLRNLAEMYDKDAREEENRAERFRQGQQK